MEELQGQILAGRFLLHELIGEGGYGAVFRAEQLSIQRACAVKIIRTDADMRHDNVVERFRAEAVATSRLHHPNTVVIYDFGEDEARQMLFLAMEYLDGKSLYAVLEERGVLDLETTLHIANQMAASLQDAHDRRIIHRDIKPHNVMVMERGQDLFAKIIDFGIARVIRESSNTTMERMTADDTMVGTPYYMAPEQIRDQRVDGRTDMYALAICIYRMLTGRTPFQGGSGIIVATQHLTDKPLPLSAYKPDLQVPRELERVLLKALEKSMDDRYPSIAQFAEALNRASGLELGWSLTGAARLNQRSGRFIPMKTPEPARPMSPESATLPISDEVKLSIKEDAAFGHTAESSSEEVLRADMEAKWKQQQPGGPRSTFMMYPVNVGPDEATTRDALDVSPGAKTASGLPGAMPAIGGHGVAVGLLEPSSDDRPGSTLAVPASQVIELAAQAPQPAPPPHTRALPSTQTVSAAAPPSPRPPMADAEQTASASVEADADAAQGSSRRTLLLAAVVAGAAFLLVTLVAVVAFKGPSSTQTDTTRAAVAQGAAVAPTDPSPQTPPSAPQDKPDAGVAADAGETAQKTAQQTAGEGEDAPKGASSPSPAQLLEAVDQGRVAALARRPLALSVSKELSKKAKPERAKPAEVEKPEPASKEQVVSVPLTIRPTGYVIVTQGSKTIYKGADGKAELVVGKTYKFEVRPSAFGDPSNQGTFSIKEGASRIIFPRDQGQKVLIN